MRVENKTVAVVATGTMFRKKMLPLSVYHREVTISDIASTNEKFCSYYKIKLFNESFEKFT